MRIKKVSGTEGPSFDSWHFDRLYFTVDGQEVVAHRGLGGWLRVGGKTLSFAELERFTGGKTFDDLLTLEQVQNGPWDQCPKCGGELTESSGYVGEPVQFCENDKCEGVTWFADPRPYCE